MSLIIEQSFDTPYIHLEKGLIRIEGRLMPENILIFFKPIDKWINKYLKHPADFTKIDFQLSYINSCASKHISDMLEKFNVKFLEGNDMKVSWTYEDNDDSALETGKDLESLVDMPFEYKTTESQLKERTRIKVKNKLTGKTGEISLRYWETIKRNGHERDFELLEND